MAKVLKNTPVHIRFVIIGAAKTVGDWAHFKDDLPVNADHGTFGVT